MQRKLQLFGPVRVESDDGDVPRFRSQRTMALLGYLVAEQRAPGFEAEIAVDLDQQLKILVEGMQHKRGGDTLLGQRDRLL